MSNLQVVVRLLKKEQERLSNELHGIGAALAALRKAYVKGTGSRKLSASARERIAAAQRARWAKVRASAKKSDKVVPIRGKRTLSAAARRKIAAAQRARWAKVKAGKKTA
jgi:Skp family chaperone for outer membrane proteins